MTDLMVVVSIFSKIKDLIDKVFLHDELEVDVLDVTWMVSTNQTEMIHLLIMVEVVSLRVQRRFSYLCFRVASVSCL